MIDALLEGLPRLLTVKQSAELLGVSQRTFRRWVSTQRVRVLRTSPGMGGHIRVPLVEIRRLLEEMEQAA